MAKKQKETHADEFSSFSFWAIREKTSGEFYQSSSGPLTDNILDSRRFETAEEAMQERKYLQNDRDARHAMVPPGSEFELEVIHVRITIRESIQALS